MGWREMRRRAPLKRRQSASGDIGPLTVQTSTTVRGHRSAVTPAALLPVEPFLPLIATIRSPRESRSRLWLHKDPDGRVPAQALAMSARHRRALHVHADGDTVTLAVPQHKIVRVRTPPATDLPVGAAGHVSARTYAELLAGDHVPRRGLLTTEDGVVVPLRLRRRRTDDDRILLPLSTRTLAGIAPGSAVQLAAIPRMPFRERHLAARQRVLGRTVSNVFLRALVTALGYILFLLRLLDIVLELLLRSVFRSQRMTFRIDRAHPGDDDLRDTIKLHPSAFDALAVRPGGQVLLHWGGQQMAVRALEDQRPFDGTLSEHVKRSVGVSVDVAPLGRDFPAHLVARIPAPVRGTLNIPPDTIIEMQRRIRPALVGHLNQLTVPIAGLVAAAAALPGVRGWPLVLGGALALVLGLAPLRMPRPPRGPWP